MSQSIRMPPTPTSHNRMGCFGKLQPITRKHVSDLIRSIGRIIINCMWLVPLYIIVSRLIESNAVAILLSTLIGGVFNVEIKEIRTKLMMLVCPKLVSPALSKCVNYTKSVQNKKQYITKSLVYFAEKSLDEYMYYAERRGIDVREIADVIDEIIHLPTQPKQLDMYNPQLADLIDTYPTRASEKFIRFSIAVTSRSQILTPKKKITPLMLIGPPGTGKTYFIEEFAKVQSLPLITINLADKRTSLHGNGIWSSKPSKGIILEALLMGKTHSNVILFFDEVDKAIMDKSRKGSVLGFLHTLLEPSCIEWNLGRYENATINISQFIIVLGANRSFTSVLGPTEAEALETRVNCVTFEGYSKDDKKKIITAHIDEWKQYNPHIVVDESVVDTIIAKDDEIGYKGVRVLLRRVIDVYLETIATQSQYNFYSHDTHHGFDVDECYSHIPPPVKDEPVKEETNEE